MASLELSHSASLCTPGEELLLFVSVEGESVYLHDLSQQSISDYNVLPLS